MNLKVDIINRPKKNVEKEIRINNPENVFELKDVQAIKNAIREHLLFIGLDSQNNLREVSLLGIGTTNSVPIDTREIIRIALFSASDKVILVHNHPSNSLEPSSADLHLTSRTKELLKAFSIELIDHIIVTEKDYVSMERIGSIENENKSIVDQNINNHLLVEENIKLKNEISNLKKQLDSKEREDEEELEI